MRPLFLTLTRITQRCLKMLALTLLLITSLWSVGAVYYLDYLPRFAATLLAATYGVAVIGACIKHPGKRCVQFITLSIAIVYLLTLAQQPSNNRDWADDNATLSEVEIVNDRVVVSGFRNSRYRSETDYDVHYETFKFELSKLDKAWFVVQRFTALEGIAHNFLTFRVQSESGPRFFSISVEIRREQEEAFSPVKGLFRQYELIYVVADERDEIGSRTVMRPNDRVFLYPVNAAPDEIQTLFRNVAQRINKLQDEPEFYHSLLNNCTNNIVLHTYDLTPDRIHWLDPRIVAPGFADRLAFAEELIGKPGQSFEQLKAECRIDIRARKVGITPGFSKDIRTAK